MKTATYERERAQGNNDPLAHVYLLLDSYDGKLAEHRIYTEFITDMGERLIDQPFKSTYHYTFTDKEITYDTGLQYLASLEQSYIAAHNDVARGAFSEYHVQRQYAFKQQGEQILEWLQASDGPKHLLVVSMCPNNEELSYEEAKKQSFKPDRLMASLQVHTKLSDTDATTTAFSLDGLSTERLQAVLHALGLPDTVAETTLAQITQPIALYSDISPKEITDTFIHAYDSLRSHEDSGSYKQGVSLEKRTVEANAFVAEYPEAFRLYKTVVAHVATSLREGRVQHELAHVVHKNLTSQYETSVIIPSFLTISAGDYFTTYMASELIDYLRKRAIPEYLSMQLATAESSDTYVSYGDIGSAGASAMQSGRTYDGACPSSSNETNSQQAVIDQAAILGVNVVVSQEAPKPLFVIGNYAVIPIGSCPASCGTECGIGIKDIKTGTWYCANSKRCSGYNADVYNFVFNPESVEGTPNNNQSSDKRHNTILNSDLRSDVSSELREVQAYLWHLRTMLFNEALTDGERQDVVTYLIATDQRKQHLLRVAIGKEAYIQAEEAKAA